MIRIAPSRHVQMTVKNLASIAPMLRNRSSSSPCVGTVRSGRPSNKGVGSKEKIYASFGQYPFALRFVPAEIHSGASPQLYPQSSEAVFIREADCLRSRLRKLCRGSLTALSYRTTARSAQMVSGSPIQSAPHTHPQSPAPNPHPPLASRREPKDHPPSPSTTRSLFPLIPNPRRFPARPR